MINRGLLSAMVSTWLLLLLAYVLLDPALWLPTLRPGREGSFNPWRVPVGLSEHVISDFLHFEGPVLVEIERSYVIYLPPPGRPTQKLPLVLIFHDSNQTAWHLIEKMTDWTGLAKEEQFVAVFCQALGDLHDRYSGDTAWKSGWATRNDISYVQAVATTVMAKFPIDRNRIYTVGIADGAQIAINFGIRNSDIVAAVGCFLGAFRRRANLDPIEAFRKIPFVFLMGSRDRRMGLLVDSKRVLGMLGHNTTIIKIEGMLHRYKTQHERLLWQHLSKLTLMQFNAKPQHPEQHSLPAEIPRVPFTIVPRPM